MANKETESQETNEDLEQKEEIQLEYDELEQLSSLDLLWRHAFGELDEWAKRADFRDEVLLKEAKLFSESIKRNQGNVKEIIEKFNKEFAEWERMAREEFLMSTTSLQHFFPIRSYEEINAQIDKIQKKTMSILDAPCHTVNSYFTMDKDIEMIDQYISLRKKGRMRYIHAVKQVGNLIYESQRGFVNLFARQIKTIMFPLNKYLEKTEEL
ncbi:hypothetical protein QE429_003792 [Bacillus sp. SORGH_AS 510]|nr:hypothetical protein [Bacillus sp. SORGH_AS_0510]